MTKPHRNRIALRLALLSVAAGSLSGVSADGVPLAERVELAARHAAGGLVEAPDRFEIESVRFTGASDEPAGNVVLELVESNGPNASGRVRMQFAMVVGQTPLGHAWASLHGAVRGPAVVVENTLRGGEVIRSRDLEVVDADLTRVSSAPLRDPAETVGVVPVRSLGSGRVLTQDLLRPAPIVRRGDTVDLYVRRPGLVVAVPAIVRRDGAEGETVTVDNLSSGARLLARVESDGSLTVLRGSIARRRP